MESRALEKHYVFYLCLYKIGVANYYSTEDFNGNQGK